MTVEPAQRTTPRRPRVPSPLHGRRGGRLHDRLAALPFLAPAVLLVGLVLILPFLATIIDSFGSDLGGEVPTTRNYGRIFEDDALQKSLINTVMWAVGSLTIPVVLGFAIALATHQLPFGRLLRSAIVLPYAFSGTAVAVVWAFMLSTDGAINTALETFGLDQLARPWLQSWPTNTIVLILANAWQAVGVTVILFLVGLHTVPPETMEAAALDGASGWRKFWYVLLPQMRTVTAVVIGITLANALKTFDVIWVLTQGGPARSSETLGLSMYRESFLLQRPASGAAVAVVLTVVVLAVSWLYLRDQAKERG